MSNNFQVQPKFSQTGLDGYINPRYIDFLFNALTNWYIINTVLDQCSAVLR